MDKNIMLRLHQSSLIIKPQRANAIILPKFNNANNNFYSNKPKFIHKPFSGNPSNKISLNYDKTSIANRDINTAIPRLPQAKIKNVVFKIHYHNINSLCNHHLNKNEQKNQNRLFINSNSLNKSQKMKINNNKPSQMKNAINSASIKRNKSPMIVKQQKIKIKAINFKSNNNIDYAYKEEQNLEYRKQMEDFHIEIPNYGDEPSMSYFAIFDGHNGINAASHCKDYLHKILKRKLQETNYDIDKSFHFAFNKISTEINSLYTEKDTGTTATVVLIKEEKGERVLYCANVGDSKCYIIKRNKKSELISTDHICTDINEVTRVKSSGGIVFGGRVFGTLMLTRSIGDLEMKNYGVIATPSIKKHCLTQDDMYVVLASDGVWDIIDQDKLTSLGEGSANDVCDRIVKFAVNGGTRDNVSCIVVKLY